MPDHPRRHNPQSKEQSARRVMATFGVLLALAVVTMGVFATLIVLIARAKGFALWG